MGSFTALIVLRCHAEARKPPCQVAGSGQRHGTGAERSNTLPERDSHSPLPTPGPVLSFAFLVYPNRVIITPAPGQ